MKRAAGSETLYPRRSPTKLPTAGCPVSQCRVDSVKTAYDGSTRSKPCLSTIGHRYLLPKIERCLEQNSFA